MTNLVIFDMDGTLADPPGGGFPKHPRDKVLRPNVLEKIETLQREGHVLAVASNQGGCAAFEVEAKELKPGMWIHYPDTRLKILKIENHTSEEGLKSKLVYHSDYKHEGDFQMFPLSEKVLVQYKTIVEVIEEMVYLQELTGIDILAFCPDSPKTKGETMLLKYQGSWSRLTLGDLKVGFLNAGFRKPDGGMLTMIWQKLDRKFNRLIFVGDREEDFLASRSAGFEFYYEHQYFK